MANAIASRIVNFIKGFPPFNEISIDDLNALSNTAIVSYHKKGEYVFQQGDPKGQYLFIVREGIINLERISGEDITLVDICDEGDIFGVRAMLSGNPYVFSARCEEESLVYGFPLNDFKAIVDSNPKVSAFFASGLAGGQQILLEKKTSAGSLPGKETGSLLNWNRPLTTLNKELIAINPDKTIGEAVLLMNDKAIGSLIICNKDNSPIGIITDTDFRKKYILSDYTPVSSVDCIMTREVITMPLGLPLSQYLLKMLKYRIRHICIVDEREKAIGIVSERDLMAAHQNHPVTLAFAMEQSNSIDDLVELRNRADGLISFYLEQNVSIALTSQLITHLNDVVIKRAIKLAIEELESNGHEAPCKFTWLSLGSEGREEQLLRTDQDNALIFYDGVKEAQSYFTKLSENVNNILNQCGFEYCPANMMASNLDWCKPLSEWKNQFSEWIIQPDEKSLMFASIFFDFRAVYGENVLADALKDHIKKEIDKTDIFINFLAKNSLKNPAPLGFFKGILVERSGEHKNEFDLKARGMMPLADMARVLALDNHMLEKSNSVYRFQQMMSLDKKNAEIYQSAIEAYEYFMHLRATTGFEENHSGRFIKINELTKLQKQVLRNYFEPIHQLQRMCSTRYQLDYFRS